MVSNENGYLERCEIDMIKLNSEILEVLCMVYHYKHYRSAMARLYPEQKINWYEDTRKFYFELDLPEGFNKNEIDFDRVMQFIPDFRPYKEWMETNEDELDKFIWKKGE